MFTDRVKALTTLFLLSFLSAPHSYAAPPSAGSSTSILSTAGKTVCANWFGNNVDWNKIQSSGIATRYGTTPWGIMTGNKCNKSIVSGYGAYNCGTYNTQTNGFKSCKPFGCNRGKCQGADKLRTP